MIKVHCAVLVLSLLAFFCIPQACFPYLSRATDKLLKHATRGTLTQQCWENICHGCNTNEFSIILRYLPEILQEAVKSGHTEATHILFENCRTYSLETQPDALLKLAAKYGQVSILIYFLSHVNYSKTTLDDALISACLENQSQAAKVLLACGANSNVKMASENTLLSTVTRKGYFAIMQLLLQNSADFHASNDALLGLLTKSDASTYSVRGLKILMEWTKNVNAIPFRSELIEQHYADIEQQLEQQGQGCWSLLKRKKLQKILDLLQKCKDIGRTRLEDDINLQFIQQTSHETFSIEQLQSLAAQQADVHAFDDYALRHAVLQSNVIAVSVLLCINLIPSIPPFKQELIRELLEFCNTQIALRTIQHNVYIQITEKLAFYQNQQRFIEAVQHGTITTAPQLQKLIDEGADVHWNNEWALRWAVMQSNSQLIGLLKRYRPNLTINDNEFFHLALAHGHRNLVPLLINPAIAKQELEKAVHSNNIGILNSVISWARERIPCPVSTEFIKALRICAEELEKHEIANRLQELENYLMRTEVGALTESNAIPSTEARITEETPLHPTASIEQELAARSEFVEIPLVIER